MSASKRTMDLGESTLKRREFLAVGGATIAATAVHTLTQARSARR